MKFFLVFLILACIVGCDKQEIKTYEVSKEINSLPQLEKEEPKTKSIMASDFYASIPNGWTEKGPSGMRKVSYLIDNSSIDFYAIELGMGDVTSNVNRWRKQIELNELGEDEILSSVKNLNAGGVPVKYFEIYNPNINKGILAAIIERKPSFWFFTAKGNIDELKYHNADIQRFINSINFN